MYIGLYPKFWVSGYLRKNAAVLRKPHMFHRLITLHLLMYTKLQLSNKKLCLCSFSESVKVPTHVRTEPHHILLHVVISLENEDWQEWQVLLVCVCVWGGGSLLSIKPFLSYKFLNFRSILINSVVFGHQEMADLRFLMYLRFIFRFIPLNGIKFSIKDLKIYQIFVCCLFLDFLVYLRFPRSDGEYFCFFLKNFRDLGDIFGMGGPETLDDTMI